MSDEFSKGFAQAESKKQEMQKDIDKEMKATQNRQTKPKAVRETRQVFEDTKGGDDDEIYHKRPQQQNQRTYQKRNQDGEYAPQKYEGRGRGSYRGRGRGNYYRTEEDGEEGRTYYGRGNYRGKRGGYQRQYEEGEGNDEGRPYRGRGRGGFERGTRGRGYGGAYKDRDYYTQRQKQSRRYDDEDGSDSDELTWQQQAFIKRKQDELGTQLKDLVTLNQIGKKCIDFNFNDEKVKEWVTQLTSKTDFEWEDAKTTGQKRAERAKKMFDQKNKKQIVEEKKRKHEEWLQRKEEKEARQQAYLAKQTEREEKRKADAEKKNNKEADNGKQFTVKQSGQTLTYQAKKTASKKVADENTEAEKVEVKEDPASDDDDEEYDEDEYDEDYDAEAGEYSDPAIAAMEDGNVDEAKDSEKAASELLHEAATQQQREHEERVRREKEEVDRQKKDGAVKSKKKDNAQSHEAEQAAKTTKESPAAANPLAGMVMPGMLPTNSMKPADAKDSGMPQQTAGVVSAYDAYNHMLFHQQMAQHYQAIFTQQMAVQQQALSSQGGNTDQSAASVQQIYMQQQQQQLGFPMAGGLPTAGLSGLMQPTNGQGSSEQQSLPGMVPGFLPMFPFPMNQGAAGMSNGGMFAPPMQFPTQQNQGQSSGKDEAQ